MRFRHGPLTDTAAKPINEVPDYIEGAKTGRGGDHGLARGAPFLRRYDYETCRNHRNGRIDSHWAFSN